MLTPVGSCEKKNRRNNNNVDDSVNVWGKHKNRDTKPTSALLVSSAGSDAGDESFSQLELLFSITAAKTCLSHYPAIV